MLWRHYTTSQYALRMESSSMRNMNRKCPIAGSSKAQCHDVLTSDSDCIAPEATILPTNLSHAAVASRNGSLCLMRSNSSINTVRTSFLAVRMPEHMSSEKGVWSDGRSCGGLTGTGAGL